MPEVSKEAFEAPKQDNTVAMQPDAAADMIQDDEGKKLKAVLSTLEGHAA